jgi:hypothetical protein
MKRTPTALHHLFVGVLLCTLLLHGGPLYAEKKAGRIDWKRVARLKPQLKVLVLVDSDRPISLADLSLLAGRGLKPADRDPGLVLGLQSSVFQTKLEKWREGTCLPSHMKGRILDRFYMTGIYRVGFKVQAKGYVGPLKLEVTAPRDGFGRKLEYAEHVVRPRCTTSLKIDNGGNRWLTAEFPEVHHGQIIKFHFGFDYLVDLAELLNHDLILAGEPLSTQVPSDVASFLRPGYKIDPGLSAAYSWASAGGSGFPDARKEWRRLEKFIKETVTYNNEKRAAYFNGRMVYADVDMMYQDVTDTLARGSGCCPDTVLLECAFLRARGIPCRTAGRFGHFYSVVYVPGRGWMSTSVTPTGIPLILSSGPDHIPYQNWTPRIPLKTTHWEARVRIETAED